MEPADTVIDLTNSTKSQSLSLKKPKRDRHDNQSTTSNPVESLNNPSMRNNNTSSSVNDPIPPSYPSSSSRTNTKPATITTNNNDADDFDDDLQFFTPSPRLAPDITRRTSNASLSSVTTINTTDHPIEPMVTDLAVCVTKCVFIFMHN